MNAREPRAISAEMVLDSIAYAIKQRDGAPPGDKYQYSYWANKVVDLTTRLAQLRPAGHPVYGDDK